MLRKAVLIESSNVKGEDDLPGARIDVQNWKNFLMSDLGGDWTESEIQILSKPYSSDVEKELAVPNDSYCFVAFSGHGCDGAVALNDHNKNFSIQSLKPKSARGTVIVDSCRGIVEAKIAAFKADFIALANSTSGLPVVLNSMRGGKTDFLLTEAVRTKAAVQRISALAVWEKAMSGCDRGIVEMYACAKGQGAGEDPDAGGYYTSLLMQSAEQWRLRAVNGSVHSTKDAHDFAARKLPAQQTPEYKPSGLAFPFAVQVI